MRWKWASAVLMLLIGAVAGGTASVGIMACYHKRVSDALEPRVQVFRDDLNNDGMTDFFSVSVTDHGRPHLTYYLEDTNSDGLLNCAALEVGAMRIAVTPFDDTLDGKPDRLGFVLRHTEDEWINYQDYNYDGIIDAMHRIRWPSREAIESYILLDGCWTQVLYTERTENGWEAELYEPTNTSERAVFVDSRWRLQ